MAVGAETTRVKLVKVRRDERYRLVHSQVPPFAVQLVVEVPSVHFAQAVPVLGSVPEVQTCLGPVAVQLHV